MKWPRVVISNRDRDTKSLGDLMPYKSTDMIARTCSVCSKAFLARPTQVRAGKGLYCSHHCANAARIVKVARTCEWCDTGFWSVPSDISLGYGRFCSQSCRAKAQATDPVEQFWKLVDIPDGADDCWIWTGTKDKSGYGRLSVYSDPTGVHRFSYELLCGQIPDGLHIDHLCRTPSCVNPEHLEPVTPQTNVLRGFGMAARNARRTHCKSGHLLAGDNLGIVVGKSGYPNRQCRTCLRIRQAKAYERHKAKMLLNRVEMSVAS